MDNGVDVWGACEEQAQHIFDDAARRYLGISGEDFIRSWDAGDFEHDPESNPGVMRVAMLLPLVR
jgi:hypothetical protein